MKALGSAYKQELYQKIDEVVHYIWDPIGIREFPEARNEYFSYLPEIYNLVIESQGSERLTSFLNDMQTNQMGLQETRTKK